MGIEIEIEIRMEMKPKIRIWNLLGKYSYFGEKTRKYRTIEISRDDADTTRIEL